MKPAERRSEQQERRGRGRPPYSVEMGTKALLSFLVALAVVCGMFFAFGYNIGKHAIPSTFTLGSAPETQAATAPAPSGVQAPNPAQLGAAESNQTPNTLTPAATSAPGQASAPDSPPAAAGTGAATAPAAGATAPPNPPASPASNVAPPAANANSNTAPAAAKMQPADSHATPVPQSQPSDGGLFLVQVFVGMQNDAQSLANALQNRGYPANVVAPVANAPSQLYRVQVGPYLTQAEAQAMRSRLTADGYQAVVKTGGN